MNLQCYMSIIGIKVTCKYNVSRVLKKMLKVCDLQNNMKMLINYGCLQPRERKKNITFAVVKK